MVCTGVIIATLSQHFIIFTLTAPSGQGCIEALDVYFLMQGMSSILEEERVPNFQI